MIIKNYGRFWKKSAINWGSSQRPGDLGGMGEWNKGGADFREQVAIYILHAQDFTPVYVGQTGRGKAKLLNRLKAHAADPRMADRWEYFSWFGFRAANADGSLGRINQRLHIDFTTVLDQIEAILICALEPKFNRRSGVWQQAEEYFQAATQEQWGYSHNDLFHEVRAMSEGVNDLAIAVKKVLRTSVSKKTRQ